ncbi:MAG: hypothetical protein H6Q79_2631, partial [Deltaproteobacteria bacterium]|nr:hypothetical protein [Deltaproteobacteria bacterium]
MVYGQVSFPKMVTMRGIPILPVRIYAGDETPTPAMALRRWMRNEVGGCVDISAEASGPNSRSGLT